MKLKIIKTEDEYENALAEIEKLLAIDDLSEDQLDTLDIISLLIEKYEQENYPIEMPTPVEAIKFRMDQDGLTRKDMEKYIGSASKVSEVLNGKKPLSLSMMRALHEGLGISADILLQEPGKELPEECYKLSDYPFNEMFKLNYFDNFSGTIRQAKEQHEELLIAFFGDFDCKQQIYCKKSKNNYDSNSLASWQCKVMKEAKKENIPEYKPESLDDKFFSDLVKLSCYPHGPLVAKDMLNRHGIHLIISKHLSGTHLDGAAMMLQDGHPVVGLTLRYDRVDNFWFTLLHELSHIRLHLKDSSKSFFDDIENHKRNGTSSMEAEADTMAINALIPPDIWKIHKCKLIEGSSDLGIIELADKIQISPAIIAGRFRWEQGNYRLHSKLLGHGKIRSLFNFENH